MKLKILLLAAMVMLPPAAKPGTPAAQQRN